MSGLHDALLFLVNSVFDIYLFVLMARVLLAFAGANYFDPITQFVVRCTDFIVKPVRRVIPNSHGIEISTLLIIVALAFIKYVLIAVLSFASFNVPGLMIIAFADTLRLLLQTYFYALILQALMSWIQPMSPVNMLLYRITAPVLRPIQRFVPPVGGMDISPIPAMILLQLLIILLVNPLMSFGLGVTLG